MDIEKKKAREEAINNHTGEIYGVVVLFDIWLNERTGERRLQEIGRSEILPYFTALTIYAETPNPASQLLKFRSNEEYLEVSDELKEDIKNPEWLHILFQQYNMAQSYEQMMAEKAEYKQWCLAQNIVNLTVFRSVDRANQRLNAMINDLRHTMNDQLIDLKYGRGYKASFLDEILIQVEKL